MIAAPVVLMVRLGSLVMSLHPSALVLIRSDCAPEECSRKRCLPSEMKQAVEM